MKILLIGRTGQLGGDILKNGGSLHEISAPSRDKLDVGNPKQLRETVLGFRPDAVINTSAFHNVAECEEKWRDAFAVNFIAVRNIALASKEAGAALVTFSTDYVFDGEKGAPYNEDETPSPVQAYGLSKLAGEYAALAAWPEKTYVIRTCGLYGASGAISKGGNFVDKRIADARATKQMEMSSDQTVSPTCTHDLSLAVLNLLEKKDALPGIYHLISEGHCTWHEFTEAIYAIAGLDVKVVPVDRGGMAGGVRKPRFSVLRNNKARALGITLPHWRESLERYIHEKYR